MEIDRRAFIASLGGTRTSRMRDVLATIQSDQDVIIRAGSRGALVVDGGPGTGKTVVALHRSAYLLFEHRRRLARDGVLVIGPNRAFLDYVGNVLPSLGERSVRQTTVIDLCVPKVDVTNQTNIHRAIPPKGRTTSAYSTVQIFGRAVNGCAASYEWPNCNSVPSDQCGPTS